MTQYHEYLIEITYISNNLYSAKAGAAPRRATSSPARVCKKPAGKAGTSKDPRTNGRWLWIGVAVGKGKQRYTHSNGLKRIAFEWLPSKELVPKGGPRGITFHEGRGKEARETEILLCL